MSEEFSPIDNGKEIPVLLMFLGNTKQDKNKRYAMIDGGWHWIATDITHVGDTYHVLVKRQQPQPDSE